MARSGRKGGKSRSAAPHARNAAAKRGMRPGAAVYVGPERTEAIHVRVLDYDDEAVRIEENPSDDAMAGWSQSPTVTWVDLDGVHLTDDVVRIGEQFGLHPLWIEDLLHPGGRPKVEQVGDQLFIRLRMIRPPAGADDPPDVETIGLVLGPTWVLSFQERPGDVWDAVRERIVEKRGRIRSKGADYLMHALLDAVVDAYFGVLEHLELRVDDLEDAALANPDAALPGAIATLKSDLGTVRAGVWPVREALSLLVRERGVLISAEVVPFFRDVLDHLAQVVDHVDSMRERLLGAIELSLAVSGHRLNEIMRVLTIVSTLFLPMTFLAGIWGMNFDLMPELHTTWGYPIALFTMIGSAVAMVSWFRGRGWL